MGVDVILENGFWTRAEREEMRELAFKARADIKIYTFEVTRDELLRRLKIRNNELPPHTFHIEESRLDEALKYFEPPTPGEANVIVVR